MTRISFVSALRIAAEEHFASAYADGVSAERLLSYPLKRIGVVIAIVEKGRVVRIGVNHNKVQVRIDGFEHHEDRQRKGNHRANISTIISGS